MNSTPNDASEFTFYIVWRRDGQGRPPSVEHESAQAAEREAERLALLNPGVTYVVLKGVSMRLSDTMKRINLEDCPF